MTNKAKSNDPFFERSCRLSLGFPRPPSCLFPIPQRQGLLLENGIRPLIRLAMSVPRRQTERPLELALRQAAFADLRRPRSLPFPVPIYSIDYSRNKHDPSYSQKLAISSFVVRGGTNYLQVLGQPNASHVRSSFLVAFNPLACPIAHQIETITRTPRTPTSPSLPLRRSLTLQPVSLGNPPPSRVRPLARPLERSWRRRAMRCGYSSTSLPKAAARETPGGREDSKTRPCSFMYVLDPACGGCGRPAFVLLLSERACTLVGFRNL
jgi:hypothetical protein